MDTSRVNNDSRDRQLVRPSAENPWDVQVVSVAPKKVVADVLLATSTKEVAAFSPTDKHEQVVGAATDGWVAVFRNHVRLWPIQDASPSSFSSSLDPPSAIHTLFHPDFTKRSSQPILLSIATDMTSTAPSRTSTERSSSSNNWLHVYAAHPDEGTLCFWNISPNESGSWGARPVQARIKLSLEGMGEHLTCLTQLRKHHIVVGTSHSRRLYWITQTTLPILLHAQELQRTADSKGGSSWLGRLLTPRKPPKRPRVEEGDENAAAAAEAVHSILTLPVSQSTITTSTTLAAREPVAFLCITRHGKMELWRGTTSKTLSTAEPVDLKETELDSLSSMVQEHASLEVSLSDAPLDVLRSAVDTNGDDSKATIHVVVRHNRSRIYWIHFALDTNSKTADVLSPHVTWLNRFHPEVDCAGLVCTRPHVAYAVFQYPKHHNGPVTCVAYNGASFFEVDYPQSHVPRLVPDTLGRDVVTHGCWGLAWSGLGICSRVMMEQQQQQEQYVSVQQKQEAGGGVLSDSMLVRHMQSEFWHWYQHPGTVIRVPPSLLAASSESLGWAMVETAHKLQRQPVQQQQQQHSGHHHYSNILECHLAFLQWLRQGGLYRSLSVAGQWTLLGIGQELAVYLELSQHQQHQATELQLPKPYDTAKALWEQLQPSSSGSYFALCNALQVAVAFRNDKAQSVYDIVNGHSNPPTSERFLWTTHEELQRLLRRILAEASDDVLSLEQTKLLVHATLQSHRESRLVTDDDAQVYEEVKAVAISRIRRILPDDKLAFQLAVEHEWYEGLCQMAHDHPKDASFDLVPLFSKFEASHQFASFVLDWHLERDLIAHVLNYGRLCPAELQTRCMSDERMIPHRWVAAVRLRQFGLAGDWLLQAALEGASSSPLSKTQRALSLAKLSLPPMKASKAIDDKLELVRAQEMLLGETHTPLKTPERLLAIAMDKLQQVSRVFTTTTEDSLNYAMIGLGIAKAMDRREDVIHSAALVWSKCVAAELDRWMEWVETQSDLMNLQLVTLIHETTLFGAVWMEVRREPRSDVTYGATLENEVVELLGLDAMRSVSMKRLLGSVTSELWTSISPQRYSVQEDPMI